MWLTDTQKIGVGITSAGVMFLMLGSMLFFDGPLLALGNILFLTGITFVIGPQKTYYFFARRNKVRGTICFLGGILLVFLKYPFFGILIEMFGFLNLFGDFFPVILSFLRQMPVIGSFLSLPYVRGLTDRLAGVRQSPVWSSWNVLIGTLDFTPTPSLFSANLNVKKSTFHTKRNMIVSTLFILPIHLSLLCLVFALFASLT